jgi:hypothetical protein
MVADSPAHDTLRTALSDALDAVDPTLRDRLLTDPQAYLDLVSLTAQARSETDAMLRLAVTGARSAGCTWEQVGRVLDMSRQAAQQRYGVPEETGTSHEGRTARLAPLTAFTEMPVLDRAGRYGWELVSCHLATLVVRKTDVQWEHERVFASRGTTRSLENQGWTVVAAWFPWTYLKRPTDREAEPEPQRDDYLMNP